ncbi:hypothetical protein KLP28_06315 [Nocardioidaceae bacterium]|nr:hypothetical protein KLP28_06315 [Nocardioidaceae bacterium]
MSTPFLSDLRVPGDLDRGDPWTRAMARDCGVGDHDLRALLEAGLVRRILRGAYATSDVADTLSLRLAALRLVVPSTSVTTDGSAAWLFAGDAALAPGEHISLEPPTVFDARRGRRLRRSDVASGTRDLEPGDVIEIEGVRVTSLVRTAMDVARLQHPQRALATLDALLRHTSLVNAEMVAELARFRGARGIVQARSLVRWADGRAESYGESAGRYVWLTTPGLPPPQLQVPVEVDGHVFYLDLADEDLMIGVEYDGERWHGPDRAEHDDWRRSLIEELGWLLVVLRRRHVFGRDRNVEQILVRTFHQRRQARERAERESTSRGK